MTLPFLLAVIVCVAGACRGDDRRKSPIAAGTERATTAAAPAAPDSEYDTAVQLRRFRDSVGDMPAALAGDESSREALVRRFVRAVETADTAALERMRLTAGEFAYFHYPDSKLSRPPYELEPQLAWMQIRAYDERGLRRLLQQFGGQPLGFRSLDCQPPERQGDVLLHDCGVRHIRGASGRPVVERLFGTILERHGRFKFVSYANEL